MSESELIDAGFQGPAFTWKRGNLLEHLDRLLVNLEFLTRGSISKMILFFICPTSNLIIGLFSLR